MKYLLLGLALVLMGCAHTPRATTPLLVAGLLNAEAAEIDRQAPGDPEAMQLSAAMRVLALWSASDEEIGPDQLREAITVVRGAGVVAERLGYDVPPHVLKAVDFAEVFLGGSRVGQH